MIATSHRLHGLKARSSGLLRHLWQRGGRLSRPPLEPCHCDVPPLRDAEIARGRTGGLVGRAGFDVPGLNGRTGHYSARWIGNGSGDSAAVALSNQHPCREKTIDPEQYRAHMRFPF